MHELSGKRKFIIMAGVMLGMLLGALDQTIVGTAMPRIVSELGGLAELSWVFTAYMLSSTAVVPLYGKLSDIYGRKWFFIGGIIVFVAGSMLSGASQSMLQLILFRGLQGLGGGAMMTNAMAVIGDVFPPAERGKWTGLMGAVFGLASILGPLAGGYLTDNLNWRWIFYINVPVGILAVAVLAVAIPKSVRKEKRSIDWFGSVALVGSIVPLLLALVWGGSTYPWTSERILGLFALSALMLVVFLFIESKVEEPILALKMFKNRLFNVSMIATFLTGLAMFGTIVYIPVFIQGVVGKSATNSGLLTFPMMLGMITASTIAGQLISRIGKYKILGIVGMVIGTVGMYLLSTMGVDTQNSEVIRDMVILGAGLGVTLPLFTIAVQNAFPHSELGVVTAAAQFFRSIGGTVGVAIMGGLMNSGLQTRMSDALVKHSSTVALLPKKFVAMANKPEVLLNATARDTMKAAVAKMPLPMQKAFGALSLDIKTALAGSITNIFLIGAVLLGIGAIVLFLMPEVALRKTHGERNLLEEMGAEALAEGVPLRPEDEPAFD